MDEKTRMEVRQAAQTLRRAPGEPRRIQIRFNSEGRLDGGDVAAPFELTLEATNADGELATWFEDSWWTDVIERWGDDSITVHIAPSPAALLHMVVVHQLEMIRRVAPTWRIVGHVYRDDLVDDDAIERLVLSPYDEVRVLDKTRHNPAPSDRCSMDTPLNEIFGRLRREQARVGTARPILVRLPADASRPSTQPALQKNLSAPAD